jgi:hypothetical protein
MKNQPVIRSLSALLLIIIVALLSSFLIRPGGDHFQVYLNNKLVIEEHIYGRTKNVPLKLTESTGELKVDYSHCGVTGTARTLSLKDENNKVLQEWKFIDVNPKMKDPMMVSVAQLYEFRSISGATLVYRARELNTDVVIAPVVWPKVTKTVAAKTE